VDGEAHGRREEDREERRRADTEIEHCAEPSRPDDVAGAALHGSGAGVVQEP
jgi:hypothetical protein